MSNIGDTASDEVVQVYTTWAPDDGFDGRVPVRQLVGFARLAAVGARGSREWTTTVAVDKYALVDSGGKLVVPAGKLRVSVGGHQPTEWADEASGSPCVSAVLTFQ